MVGQNETVNTEYDYAWTSGNDAGISHVRMIDKGAGGEVHEVVPNVNHLH